jgi:hypothetical protein
MAEHYLSCDWKSGFVMSPANKPRVGYLLSLEGLGLGSALTADLGVFTPFNIDGSPNYTGVTIAEGKVTCVGVIENFSWGGGVGDPVCISAYISSDNANMIGAKLKETIKTTAITKLAWWIVNYDQTDKKVWYEEAYPATPLAITAQLNSGGGQNYRLSVAEQGTVVAPNIDVKVHSLYIEAVPAANQTCVFHFATSSDKKFVKNWGLKVGATPAAAIPPAT